MQGPPRALLAYIYLVILNCGFPCKSGKSRFRVVQAANLWARSSISCLVLDLGAPIFTPVIIESAAWGQCVHSMHVNCEY